jgi:hypothetical protein
MDPVWLFAAFGAGAVFGYILRGALDKTTPANRR